MNIKADRAYETSDGSLVLLTLSKGILMGTILPNTRYGLSRSKKYRTYTVEGACENNNRQWDIVAQVPKSMMDNILRHTHE